METQKIKIRLPGKDNQTWMAAYLLFCTLTARILDAFGIGFSNSNVAALVTEAAALILPLIAWILTYKKASFQQLWFRPVAKNQIPLIILMMLLLPVLSLILALPFGNMKYLDASYQLYGLFTPYSGGTFGDICLIILVYIILPVLTEELLFRCILAHSFYRYGPIVTAVLSSLLYAFLGFSFGNLFVRFAIGICLYLILYVTRSVTSVLIVRLFYQLYVIYFQQEIVSFYRSAGSGTLFIFLVLIILLLLSFGICTCMIRLNLHHAKNLSDNADSYRARQEQKLTDQLKAHLILLRNASLDPSLWVSLVIFLISLFV